MKEVINQVKSLVAGDLVCVEWCDASIGKSLSNGIGGIDVPVKSWGVFIGVLGKRRTPKTSQSSRTHPSSKPSAKTPPKPSKPSAKSD